mmetsp:Transcript_30911/g.92657  ORF Transcript_30911/g.92657 Transcript_30911/m.92657 type:complete len:230 (+) Transcript_30911:2195-2884(+)
MVPVRSLRVPLFERSLRPPPQMLRVRRLRGEARRAAGRRGRREDGRGRAAVVLRESGGPRRGAPRVWVRGARRGFYRGFIAEPRRAARRKGPEPHRRGGARGRRALRVAHDPRRVRQVRRRRADARVGREAAHGRVGAGIGRRVIGRLRAVRREAGVRVRPPREPVLAERHQRLRDVVGVARRGAAVFRETPRAGFRILAAGRRRRAFVGLRAEDGFRIGDARLVLARL